MMPSRLRWVTASRLSAEISLDFLSFSVLQRPVAGDQVELFQRQGYRDAQVVVVPRLEDELVYRAVVDGAHHRIGIGMAGEHDADGFR